MGAASAVTRRAGPSVLQGVLPFDRARLPADAVAGLTLAALAIPEVMGYAKIAGTPVITGLYTILVPIAVYAVLGSSRHLVVGADSATAAIMAAGLAGLAPLASPAYVALAGVLALFTAGLLLVARVLRLGFFADFLSRSVLIGFLTGVGVQVAMGQVAGMLGVPAGSGRGPIAQFVRTLGKVGDASGATLAVSASVLGTILALRVVDRRIPGGLVAVVGAIAVSWVFDLAGHGVAVLGPVPSGLPHLGVPHPGWGQWETLLPIAGAMFVVILAQSAATSRSYAARYGERFDENVDLVGLAAANLAAGLTGAFVVNGSPTKTQMVDGAGGRSQVASLATSLSVLIVLLFLTKPLQYLPDAALAAIVFQIGIELVDIPGMRTVLRRRTDEFVIAAITAAVVVAAGVEKGIVLAIVLSVVDHLRFSYRPRDTYLAVTPAGHVRPVPVAGAARPVEIAPGLVAYRFGANLYYANANRLEEQVRGIVAAEPAPAWLCLDAVAVGDVDFTGGEVLRGLHAVAQERGVRLVLAEVAAPVRAELNRDGVTDLVGADAFFEPVADAVDAYRARAAAPH
jgi:high affinity sulfate transporter 1